MESVSQAGKGVQPSVVLSIVGGALMVAGSIIAFSMFGIWSQAGMSGWGSMMGGGGGWGMMMQQGGRSFIGAVATMASISIAAGAIAIAGGYAISKRPESASGWGVGILLASIVGLFGMGGFVIGPILGIIGGILALAKK